MTSKERAKKFAGEWYAREPPGMNESTLAFFLEFAFREVAEIAAEAEHARMIRRLETLLR